MTDVSHLCSTNMGIEEDIKQQQFRNPYQKGLINIIFTFNWLNERLRSILKREKITEQQFNILRILRGAGKPISTLQIRQRMLDKASDTSRIVDRLVLKKLVKKETCTNDKRLVDVSITPEWLSLLESLDRYAHEMDALIGNLTPEEAQMLNTLLDKIRKGK
ncbi:MAG TPA: MarR family transcriptional regulator [Ferruginibacter sp.]|nr:MarR family transcriptional regulator [Ferruginibacter sp.]